MNIFVIPSWYPSVDRPINGIMIKEQHEAMCRLYSNSINVGVSLWGQQDEKYLLWAKDHIRNLTKLLSPLTSSTLAVLPNLIEYITPAFTWTQQFAKGNLKGIVNANLKNLRTFEADFGPTHLIHVQAAQPAGAVARRVSEITGIPYIITERMGPFPSIYASDTDGKLTPEYKKVYQCSAANIAVSPFQATMMKKCGINNIKVIPDFADEHFFQPAPIEQRDAFTFFALGRVEELKGMRELVEAMRLVLQQKKNVTLRIAGAGPLEEELKQQAKQLNLHDAIEWLGYLNRQQVLRELQQCNSFVLPSHYESFGVSYIEALACGKPVIATKCGGPESIVNNRNGLLVEKKNTSELAGAMLGMIENYSRYNSDEIRKDFLNRFSAQAVAPKLKAFYEDVIQKK